MNEGTEDTEDLYNSGYQDDATGKNSARREMNIPTFNNGRREAARGSLKASEGAATKAGASKAASAAGGAAGAAAGAAAKAAEKVRGGNSGNGLFTGSGRDTNAKGGKGKGKFNFKKAAPLFAILLLLIVSVGAISFIGQSFQLISLGEQIKTKDNKLSAAVYTRTETEVARRLESTDPDDTLSPYMQELFAAYGFDYIERANSDGTVARALVYKGDGDSTLVAANSVKNSLFDSLKTTGAAINNYREVASVPNGGDEIAAAWYGALNVVSAGAWYDNSAALAYERLGLNPGKFNTGNPNPTNEEIIEAAKAGSASEDINAVSGTTTYNRWHHVACEDDPNKECGYWKEEKFDNSKTQITPESTERQVSEALNARAAQAAFSTDYTKPQNNSVARTTNSTAQIKSDSSVASAIEGLVRNKTANFAQSIVTAIDQTKDGTAGGGVVMNYYGNLLNTPAKSYNIDGEEASNISATQSTSFNSWFSDNVNVDANNGIVKKYNVAVSLEEKGVVIENIDNDNPGNYNKMDSTSNNSRTTENMENAGVSYCIFNSQANKNCPNGGTSLDPSDFEIKPGVAAYTYALSSIDLNSNPAGEEAAVAFNEGISQLNDAQLKQSGGTYGSTESVAAFYRMSQDYLAKTANFDRHTKDPFDATNSNTFMGSIVSSLLPFATALRNNAIFSTVAATGTVLSSTVSSLLPSVAAAGLSELNYMNETLTDNCTAASAGMACDVYGNPIAVMEMDYMDAGKHSMESIESKMIDLGYVKEGTCNTDGGCKLSDSKKDEDFSYQQWLLCTQNDTIVNNNITTETSSKSGSSKSGNIFTAIIQAIAGFFGLGKEGVRNQITCGGNYKNNATAQERHKIYSQFTLDQRIKALMKDQEESAATAYLREYYKENPLDQSFEGIIARQSGLTIAEVKQAFASMEYAVYIARYNPAGRYQFTPHEETELDFALSQTDQDTMKTAAIVSKMHEFDELKNRNFAA